MMNLKDLNKNWLNGDLNLIKDIKTQADLDEFCFKFTMSNKENIRINMVLIKLISNHGINSPKYSKQTKNDIRYVADMLLKQQTIRENVLNEYYDEHCKQKNIMSDCKKTDQTERTSYEI